MQDVFNITYLSNWVFSCYPQGYRGFQANRIGYKIMNNSLALSYTSEDLIDTTKHKFEIIDLSVCAPDP